ncbi:MAG: hypothetical protein Q4A82_01140 [Corynebacterium sp.]|nr:hypothetical protein [Corynebacterium sp.]
MQPDLHGWEVLASGGVLTALLTTAATVLAGWLALKGKLTEVSQSRDVAAWELQKSIVDDLYHRVQVLENDRAKMQKEIWRLHTELTAMPYLRDYVRVLVEAWPEIAGALPRPPKIIEHLITGDHDVTGTPKTDLDIDQPE